MEIINRNVEASLKKNGFAATDEFSMADVFLLTYLSANVFNVREEVTKVMLAKYPLLVKYWKENSNKLEDYMSNRRPKYFV